MNAIWKKILLALGGCLVFLVVLEGALRLFGPGHPSAFIIPMNHEGEDYIDNRFFGYRFFPESMSREGDMLRYAAQKPEGTIRIAVVGESAAMGEPQPETGPARMLEVMLSLRYPERRFEVINAGMTAINSHVIQEIVRDLAVLSPDVYIIYMGNNEVVGPYGPGTPFSSVFGSPLMQYGRVLLTRLRLAGLLRSWMQPRQSTNGDWQGMTMFLDRQIPLNSPALRTCYRHFRSNLNRIVRLAQKQYAKVLLCTVAVNRDDFSPFASQFSPALSSSNQTQWLEWYDQGVALQQSNECSAALSFYHQAAELDPAPARLWFQIGQCEAAMTNRSAAAEAFAQALDRDTLRFRADSQINTIIRQQTNQTPNVVLLDCDAAFSDCTQENPDAPALFIDHVHFSMEGTFLLAQLWAEQIQHMLNLPAPKRSPTRDECRQALFHTPWKEALLADLMLERYSAPPFTMRPDNRDTFAQWGQQLQNAQKKTENLNEQMLHAQYNHALETGTRRDTVDYNLLEVLLMRQQHHYLPPAGKWLLERYPHRYDLRAMIALGDAASGQSTQGIARISNTLNADTRFTSRYLLNTADLLLRDGHPDEARLFLDAARASGKITPSHVLLDAAIHNATNAPKAQMRTLMQALDRWPFHPEITEQAALLLMQHNQPDLALKNLKRMAEHQQDNPQAALKYSAALIYLEKYDKARAQLQHLAERHPDNPDIAYQQGLLFRRLNQTEKAQHYFDKARRLRQHAS
jgi:tetratricopeptide (TPR) repeat protein